MNRWLKPGIIFGVIVVVWQFVYGFLGLYKEGGTAWIFQVVAILVTIGIITWGLLQSVKDGKRYWGQVGTGVMICVVASVLLFVGSFIFTTVAFPEFFDYMADLQAEALSQRGVPEDQIEQQLEITAFTRTPVVSAVMGVVGTMVTGFIVSLIVAAFIRKKD